VKDEPEVAPLGDVQILGPVPVEEDSDEEKETPKQEIVSREAKAESGQDQKETEAEAVKDELDDVDQPIKVEDPTDAVKEEPGLEAKQPAKKLVVKGLKATPAEIAAKKLAMQAAKKEAKDAAKAEKKAAIRTQAQVEEEKKKAVLDRMPEVLTAQIPGHYPSVHVVLKTCSSDVKPKEIRRTVGRRMIEVVLNDRLGKKVRVKCNNTDTVLVLKKLAAAQLGTRYDKLRIQKWYNIYKDHISLVDYEVHDGMGLELYYM